MKRYMLDTNAVSHVMRGHPAVTRRMLAVPMAALCISAVTEGELSFGLAKRPEATRLHRVVREFLKRVEVLPWDSTVAQGYGALRAQLEGQGRNLGAFDLLIAAHAFVTGAVLVSNDQAFRQITDLSLEDWTL